MPSSQSAQRSTGPTLEQPGRCPRIPRQPRPDLVLARRLDRVQRLLPVADRPAQDDEPVLHQPVHERRVLMPPVLLPDRAPRIPVRPVYQPHREVSHARTVLPPTDIPRPGISIIADICTPHQGCRYPRSLLLPGGRQPPGKTPGSRRAFPAFRRPALNRQAEGSQQLSPAKEATRDRGSRPDQALRPDNSGRSAELRRPPRRRHRLPRAERVRQVHHHAPDPGPGHGRPRHGQGRRPRLPRPAVPAPRGRRAARSQGLLPGPQRPGAPAGAGRQQRHRAQPGRRNPPHRGPPQCWPTRGGRPQGRPALPGHGPAARHRGRAARRPAGPHPRRAGQRPGPGGNPLDQEPDEVAGRRGQDRLRLQPPDRRDGPDRRTPHRHRGLLLLADTTVAELSATNTSLEDAFLALTSGSAEFRAAGSN